MSDSASDMLKKMRAEKAAPKEEDIKRGDPDGFYVKLIINKQRRRQLTFAVFFGFLIFSLIIGTDIRYQRHWTLSCLPITLIGLMICLIPLSEEWEYKPWQARPRQYERHQVERS